MICTNCKAEWTPPRDVSITNCPFCGKPRFEVQNSGKNAELHEVLYKIIQQYDRKKLGDTVLRGILSDLMPNLEKKHQRIFKQALDDRIGAKLLYLEDESDSVRIVKINTLKDSFRNNNGFDQTADYVVDCFLFALGWIETVNKEQYSQNGVNNLSLISQQIDMAFIDGILNKDEAKSLFSNARQSGFPDNETADLINAKIKSLNLRPIPATPESAIDLKEIICSSNWYSESDYKLKTNSKPKQISQDLQNFIQSMIEGFVLKDESFAKQKILLQNYCKNENTNYSELEKELEDFFKLLEDFKQGQSSVLKQAILKQANQCFVSSKFLEGIFKKAEAAKKQELILIAEEKRKKDKAQQLENKRLSAENRRKKFYNWLLEKDPSTGKTGGNAPIYWIPIAIVVIFVLIRAFLLS